MTVRFQKSFFSVLRLVFCVFFVPLTIASADVPTPQDDGRQELIERELNAAARREAWQNQQAPISDAQDFADASATLPVHEQQSSVEEPSETTESYEEYKESPHQFEIGTESYYYKYKESIGVKITGLKGGLTGAYQFRLHKNDELSSREDFTDITKLVNIFRLEGRFSYGQVKYEGSGTEGGIPDWNFETRGLFGSEVFLTKEFVVMPYTGLGYRYLDNEFSTTPSKVIDGTLYGSGYDRESFYVYIPIGIELKKKFENTWTASFKTEYDYFIWGKQISHLEDISVTGYANPGLDQLSNTQRHGRGWRISGRLTRHTDRFNFYVEPYFRYWHIKDSELEFVTASGAYLCEGNLCSAGLEPDNNTYEAGVNFGANF